MYRFQKPRWDTNQTPPEVISYFQSAPQEGHALDLGCGTATNCIYMAKQGWRVTGIDFVGQAIRQGKKKMEKAGFAEKIRLIRGDVTRLHQYQIPTVQYALDMGCFHSLTPYGKRAYAADLSSLMDRGATFMLLAFRPKYSRGRKIGTDIKEIRKLFSAHFLILNYENEDKPQLWYWLQKK